MENKKLSTQEILARARQQAAGGAAGDASEKPKAPAEPASPPEAKASAPAAEKSAATPAKEAPKAPAGGAPKSTKDILAAARAQAASGGGTGAKAAGGGEAKPSAAPKSTKDILAAARAQAGSGGASADAAQPATGKPAAKTVAAPQAAGDRPSLDEMLKAVREGKPVEVEAKAQGGAAPPAIPPRPLKPAPAAKAPAEIEKRRNILIALVATPFAAAWTLFTMTSAIAALATARFMMPNVLVEPPSKFKVGPASDYPPGAVSTKWTAQFGVWIVHTIYKGKDLVYALQTVCTHLGCTPNWLEGEQKFKCPCHGSGFYITGVNFEGPAPRPLERMGIRIAEDGMLEVDKSVKFQEEMGQWEDPSSFVQVG